MASDKILDALTRHGAYLHRASSAVVNRVIEHLDSSSTTMVSELRDRLESLTPAEAQAYAAGKITTSRLRGIDNLLSEFVDQFDEALQNEFMPEAKALVEHEIAYTSDVLAKAGVAEGDAPSSGKLFGAAMATPVAGSTVKDMIRDTPKTLDKRIRASVRQGLSDGQSASDIATTIRGTAALKRKDGVLQGTRNAVDRDVRTARSSLSGQASGATYKALGVREVIHTSTLDGKTCKTCANADGTVHSLDEPHPSATKHPNCRCFYRPKVPGGDEGERPYVRAERVKGRDDRAKFRSIGKMTKKQRKDAGLEVGQVSADTDFPEFFSQQDAAFQKDWLGPKRYKLYKEGGYKLSKFVDPRGKELNLDELKALDAETFRQLFDG